jgi:hypothetical protein
MEQNLSDRDFWTFATNAQQDAYSNKIELLFDMIAGKNDSGIDPLFTFIYFLNRSKDPSQSLWEEWLLIEQYYQTLCEWYKNKNLYHKIGYLITIGENLKDLIKQSLDTKKDRFEEILDSKMKESMNLNIEELSYDHDPDKLKIERILLLFNVESIRSNKSITEYYPFHFHKATQWSLEHIHAQNSEGLEKTKKEPWLLWMKYHKKLMVEILEETNDEDQMNVYADLIKEIDEMDKERITYDKFNALSIRIAQQFSESSSLPNEDIHSISNLALLSQPDNSALNNSVFEVKRREIIEMDKNGEYIPIGTRRVFLKYYNPKPSSEHYYFWSMDDRKNYLDEIKTVLKNYLPHQVEVQ